MPEHTLAFPRRSLFTPWRWSRWTWGVIAPLMLVGYVLSYAPAVRLDKDFRRTRLAPYVTHAPLFYRPVEWMIDYTPLRTPMLKWAEFWDVGLDILIASKIRTGEFFEFD